MGWLSKWLYRYMLCGGWLSEAKVSHRNIPVAPVKKMKTHREYTQTKHTLLFRVLIPQPNQPRLQPSATPNHSSIHPSKVFYRSNRLQITPKTTSVNSIVKPPHSGAPARPPKPQSPSTSPSSYEFQCQGVK